MHRLRCSILDTLSRIHASAHLGHLIGLQRSPLSALLLEALLLKVDQWASHLHLQGLLLFLLHRHRLLQRQHLLCVDGVHLHELLGAQHYGHLLRLLATGSHMLDTAPSHRL